MLSSKQRKQLMWVAIAGLAGAAAASVARRALKSGWKAVRGSDPPENPVSRDTTWGEAIAWSVATGAIIGVAHMAAQRGAAAGWERWIGERPPGL